MSEKKYLYYGLLVGIAMICIIAFVKINISEGSYVKSGLNNKEYFVQNTDDKDEAAYILSVMEEKMLVLRKHFLDNPTAYPTYKKYIDRFCQKADKLFIYENSLDNNKTSYTINKGDETVICIRSKKNFGKLHDINLVTYVTLHEVSHIACPQQDHTPLFKDIFHFFTNVATKIGIYKKINYQLDPTEYCGIMITDQVS